LQSRLALTVMATLAVPLTVAAVLLALLLPGQLSGHVNSETMTARNTLRTLINQQCQLLEQTATSVAAVSTLNNLKDSATARNAVERGAVDGVLVLDEQGRAQVDHKRAPVGLSGDKHKLVTGAPDCSAGMTAGVLAAQVHIIRPNGHRIGRAIAYTWLDSATLGTWSRQIGVDGAAIVGGQLAVRTPGDAGAAAASRAMAALGGNVVQDGRARVAALPLQALDGSSTAYALAVTQIASSYAWLPWLLALTVLLVVGLSGLLCKEMARAATRPLGELDVAAGRIAKGDFGVRTPVRSRDEVGRLAATFNAMAAALGTYVDALDRKEGELHRDLARVGEMLSSTHDLDRILTVVLETAMASVDATAGAVLLADGSGDLHLSARRGLDEWAATGADAGAETIAGRVLASGHAIVGELGSSADLQPAPGEPHLRHVMSVPLGAPHRIHGVLRLYNPSGGRGFRQRDLELIRTFAGQGATAVENVLLHREAQRLSITDGLTGLWNYRYLSMALVREIERAERFARPLALLVLDLDHFKAVNDRFGHPRGDAVLIELGKRLTQEIREIDTLARYGGEEFVLLLPETDLVGAEQLAARVLAAVREKPFGGPDPERLPLTVSVGVAVRTPGSGMDAAPLLRAADAALYEAKRNGRDCYRVARPGMAAAPPPAEPMPPAGSVPHTPPLPPTAPRDRSGLEVHWDEEELPGPKPGGARTFDLTPRRPTAPRARRDAPAGDRPRNPGRRSDG
jgi:diguanylate cyclase (GGDEF)-like protein